MSERIHVGGSHGNEPLGDGKILAKNFDGVDPADDGRNGKAQRIAQTLFRRDDALFDHLAVSSERFHAESGDAKTVQCREHLMFEASEGAIEAVEWKLTGVEWESMAQHLQMDRRVFVSAETNEPDFSLLLGVQERFGRPA